MRPCRHHAISLDSVLTIQNTSLATATFRPIPTVRPTDLLPCPAGDSNLG